MAKKKRTREHIIADLSVNYLELQVLKCGFSTERIEHDYGYDLTIFTYNDSGEFENGSIVCQLKATDSLEILADEKTISFPVEKRDLELWKDEIFPVFLVLYDAANNKAYFLYIQSYIIKKGIEVDKIGKTLNVHIPIECEVNENVIRDWARVKNDIAQQLKEVVKHGE